MWTYFVAGFGVAIEITDRYGEGCGEGAPDDGKGFERHTDYAALFAQKETNAFLGGTLWRAFRVSSELVCSQ